MKKSILALIIMALAAPAQLSGWNRYGHQVVVQIAERHLTQATRTSLASIMPYGWKKDASWMDHHRKDSVMRQTGFKHGFAVDENLQYDPNARVRKGDVLKGLLIADYNLGRLPDTSDSLKILSIRIVMHFIGDMNCPVHVAIPNHKMAGDWYLNGSNKGNFHHFYDAMPQVIFKGMSPAETAEMLDSRLGSEQESEFCKGDFIDWLNAAARDAALIYDINPVSPMHGDKCLSPDTYEASRALIERRLLAAGCQLAYLLNKYFDKQQ